jgi:hypothetical protein
VVLDDVADRAFVVVEGAPIRHIERLRHCQLHRRDVLAVPDGLEEAVCESKILQVLDRLLAQVVVDAEDRILPEDPVKRGIESLGVR